MLATFIIGLREGLEAALIVGIIAAFLRRNGKSLLPMIIGVGCAIALSLGVGVTLKLIENGLPQAAQEGMESIIGLVAVVFVTGMVVWMSAHAKDMKSELESRASTALGAGTAGALAIMAFLAVLKEGFETSVFLLATFSASQNTGLAAGGAVLGILISVGLGYAMFKGGTRINLGKFFLITAGFLIVVAAGLIMSSLGHMREAGWLNAGQQTTIDLSAIAAKGSVSGAFFTGLLGIPADPRLIQVLAWFAYVIPVGLMVFWPRSKRPGAHATFVLKTSIAATLTVAAAVLAFALPTVPTYGSNTLKFVDDAGKEAGVVIAKGTQVTITIDGATKVMDLNTVTPKTMQLGPVSQTSQYVQPLTTLPTDLPTSLNLTEVAALNGGRLPAGMNAQTAKGPYTATWSASGSRTVHLVEEQIVDFTQKQLLTLRLSGGGLASDRTFNVSGTLPGGASVNSGNYHLSDEVLTQAENAAARYEAETAEQNFWRHTVSLVLLGAAILVAASAAYGRRKHLNNTSA